MKKKSVETKKSLSDSNKIHLRNTALMGYPLRSLKYCGVVMYTHDVHDTGVDHGRLKPQLLAL